MARYNNHANAPPSIKERHRAYKMAGQRTYNRPLRIPPSIKESHKAFKMAGKNQKNSRRLQKRNEAIALIALLKMKEADDADNDIYLSIPVETIQQLEMIHTPRFLLDERTIQTVLQNGATSMTKDRLLSLLHSNKEKSFVMTVFKQYSSFTTYTVEIF